jgi:hypothetical protein
MVWGELISNYASNLALSGNVKDIHSAGGVAQVGRMLV